MNSKFCTIHCTASIGDQASLRLHALRPSESVEPVVSVAITHASISAEYLTRSSAPVAPQLQAPGSFRRPEVTGALGDALHAEYYTKTHSKCVVQKIVLNG